MHTTFVILANKLTQHNTGGLDASDILNVITAKAFPLNLKGLLLMIRTAIFPDEFGREWKLSVHIANEDGRLISQMDYSKKAPVPADKLPILFDQITALPDTIVDKAGAYQITVFLNGEIATVYPLIVQ
jgi:hypothetical protein